MKAQCCVKPHSGISLLTPYFVTLISELSDFLLKNG